MRIYYAHTVATNGGFGVLGKGILNALKTLPNVEMINSGAGFPGLDKLKAYKDIPPVDIIFTYGMPDLLEYARKLKKVQGGKPKIVHYAVWESSELPKSFVKEYKRVDQLITATEFTARCMRKQGLKPLVWHHAVDSRFRFQERMDDGVFTFLHHNAYEYRKGWEVILQAFTQEFKPHEKVKLIFKSRERRHGVWIIPEQKFFTPETLEIYENDLQRYLAKVAKFHPQIDDVVGHLTDNEMVDLNARADCFLFPAKGEGWGLPPFEAAAIGIVPIIPNKGCFTEWFNPEGMLEVKISGYLHSAPRYPGFLYQCSIRDLRRKMRWAFEHESELREMGRKASKYVLAEFNWPKVINELNVIFERILHE